MQGDELVSAEDVIESLSGMVSREKAGAIANDPANPNPQTSSPNDAAAADFTDVASLLEFINSKFSAMQSHQLFQQQRQPTQQSTDYFVNVNDYLYRVFNQSVYDYGSRKGVKRDIVLGKEGKTIRMTLFDNLSRIIDSEAFERGDTVRIRNAVITQNGSLKSINKTVISRVAPSALAISDFSTLKGYEKNIDVIGKVIEIYPIKYVNRLDGSGQVGVANCTLSDSSTTIRAAFWGSSAAATADLNVNDIVKIEFCSVHMRGEDKELYVNDSSRVFSSKLLAERFGIK